MRSRFKTRLLVCFLFIALITLISSGMILAGTLKRHVEYNYEKQTVAELDNIKDILESNFLEIGEALENILNDKDILAPLEDAGSWTSKKAYNRLYEKLASFRNRFDFFLLDSNGSFVLSTENITYGFEAPVYWGALKQAGTHPDELIIGNTMGELIPKEEGIILAKCILKNEECAGYVVALINKEQIEEQLLGLYSADSEMALLDSFYDVIYASDASMFENLHAERILNTDVFENSKGDLYYYSEKLNYGDFCLMAGRRSIFSEGLRYSIYTAMAAVGAIAVLICLIVSGIVSEGLTNPLKNITEAMNRVKQGDFSVALNSDREDEFGQLSADFDDMTKALKVYIDLRTQNQKELSESNIAMMQAQLNPHFLYNTLDTIKWMAKANHVPQIATISSYLAKILRASINPDIFVKLADEMSLIDNYIEIQKIRFPDNFTYDAELPIELEDAIVPKLLLQPLVENAIVHGLKDRKYGHVFVNAYSKEQNLIIDVEDDGCGIDEEILTILNERDQEKLKGHLGFNNVDKIIRLHYGLNYGLHAQNLTSGGARITVELPLRYGEVAVENMKEQQIYDQNSGN